MTRLAAPEGIMERLFPDRSRTLPRQRVPGNFFFTPPPYSVAVFPPSVHPNSPAIIRDWLGNYVDATGSTTAGIQEAFDHLDTFSDLVYGQVILAPGLFDGITSNIVIPSNRALVGSGMHASIIQSGTKAWADTGLLRVIDVSEVTIADLTVDGNKATNTNGRSFGIDIRGGTGVVVRNCACINHPGQNAAGTNGGDGIYINDSTGRSDDVLIDGCLLADNVRQGMSVIDVKDLRVVGCRFIGTTGTNPGAGIDIEPNTGAGDDVENIKIIGCHFEDNYFNIVVQELTTGRVVIQGCTFLPHRNTGSGSVYVPGDHVTITGCVFKFNAWAAIYLNTSDDVVISGNVILGSNNANERAGIYLLDCTRTIIQGNTIQGSASSGILLNQLAAGATADITDCIIVGNQITDCGTNAAGDAGIRLRSDNAGGQNIFRLTLIGNVINDTRGASAADWGIRTNECVAADWDTWTGWSNQVTGTVNDAGEEWSKMLPMDDAGRPAAAMAGRIIWSTTDNNFNMDDGTAWRVPGTSATT